MTVAGQCSDVTVAGQCSDVTVAGQCSDATVAGQCSDVTVAGQCSDVIVAGQYSDLPSQAHFGTVSNVNGANNGFDSRLPLPIPLPIIGKNPLYDAIETKSDLGFLHVDASTDDSDE